MTKTVCRIFSFILIAAGMTLGDSVAQDNAENAIPTDESVISNGKTLFENNCAVCHAVHEQVVGPALKDVHERRPLPWLKGFIINSQKVIQSGDEYAVELYNEYNKTEMPSFDYSDDEVLSILAYIKQESEKAPVEETAAADAGAGAVATQAADPLSSTYVMVILFALLIVLVLILVVLAVLISVLTKYLKQKDGLDESDHEIVDQKINVLKIVKSPGFIWFFAFLFTAIAVKTVLDGMYSIGVQEGYAPTQPIAFSHKLHAGQYSIECQYCHTGVMESKSANIPSPNICMNCHSMIQNIEGESGVSAEIQKIYDAVENNQPIEWIRVHNLPDLAYFNHAQHYAVGGIECQTCHGPIEEMEVVQQHANLTMGWCINCHRETEVNAKDNAYYDKLVELHSAEGKLPMTVEEVGGLECAKCHY
jgi:mono/diheme cytochrome c family protein